MASPRAEGQSISKTGDFSAAAAQTIPKPTSTQSMGTGAAPRIAVYAYGRFQPPHRKHGEVVELLTQDAAAVGGNAFLFPSQSYNNFENSVNKTLSHPTKGKKSRKKQLQNPLHIRDKLKFLNFYFGHLPIEIIDVETAGLTNIIQADDWLKGLGYHPRILWVGEDRTENFKKTFSNIRGEDRIKSGEVIIKTLSRPGDDQPGGFSASHIRQHALDDNWEEFYAAVGGNDPCVKRAQLLMQKIKYGMNTDRWRGKRAQGGGKRRRKFRRRKSRRKRRCSRRRRRRRRRTRRKKRR